MALHRDPFGLLEREVVRSRDITRTRTSLQLRMIRVRCDTRPPLKTEVSNLALKSGKVYSHDFTPLPLRNGHRNPELTLPNGICPRQRTGRELLTVPGYLQATRVSRVWFALPNICLLYTSDAADEEDSVD